MIDFLTQHERDELLVEFNDTKVDYPTDKTVVDLFEEQVARTPDNVAVVFGDVVLTYGELNQRANQLAHYLRDKYDIKADDLVSVKMERSEHLLVCILGILKSGGAYVPIDMDYPEERISYIEKDSGCRVVLDQGELELFEGVQKDCPDTAPVKVNGPGDLAYVIYTSGTTGNPKGVMIEHASVASISENWKEHYRLDQMEVNLLQLASISFDVFVGDICRSLLVGGKMIICPDDIKSDPEGLSDLIASQQVSILDGTPSLVLPLMDHMVHENKDYSSLKLLIIGSDSFNNQNYNRLKETFGGKTRIINSYGVTDIHFLIV